MPPNFGESSLPFESITPKSSPGPTVEAMTTTSITTAPTPPTQSKLEIRAPDLGAGAAGGDRRPGRLLGYARVSRHDQDVTLQLDALRAAGCQLVWTEKASGADRTRAGLAAARARGRVGGPP